MQGRFIHTITTPIRLLVLLPIYIYSHLISPMLPSHCRYTPSCSRYTISAIQYHGIFKGITLGFFRIMRCQGMFTGGVDPIPEKFSWYEIREGYREFRDKK